MSQAISSSLYDDKLLDKFITIVGVSRIKNATAGQLLYPVPCTEISHMYPCTLVCARGAIFKMRRVVGVVADYSSS